MASVPAEGSEQKINSSKKMIKISVIDTQNGFLEEEKEKSKLLEDDLELSGVVKEVKLQKGVQELVKEVDAMYSCIVAFFSFLSCFVVGVQFIAFSLLYIELSEYFEADKATIGWIGSMYMAVGNFFGILLSVIIQYYGCRVLGVLGAMVWTLGFASSAFVEKLGYLYFTYGVFGGIGFNTVVLSSFVVVQQHFSKHRSLAAGLSAAGISVGSLSSGPIIGFFIGHYGWRGTLLMMAALSIHCVIFALFYRRPRMIKPAIMVVKDVESTEATKTAAPSKQAAPSPPSNKQLLPLLRKLGKDLADLSLFRNQRFLAICFSTTCFNFGASIFYQHTPSRAVSFGVLKELSYYITTVVGIVTLIARVMGASIGNLACTDRVLEYGGSVILGGICMGLHGVSHDFVSICVIAACTGFSAGLVMTIQTTVISDIVGVSLVHRAQAFVLICMGLGALVGVPLAGRIYDKTGNYNLPFYCASVVQVFGGLFLIGTHAFFKWRDVRTSRRKQMMGGGGGAGDGDDDGAKALVQ